MSLRNRLLLPLLAFTAIFFAVVTLQVVNQQSSGVDRAHSREAQHETSVRAFLAQRLEESRNFIEVVDANQLVIDGLLHSRRDHIFEVISPFARHTTLDFLTIYDAGGEIFAQAKTGNVFGRRDTVTKWLKSVAASNRPSSSVQIINDRPALISGSRVEFGRRIVGTTISGDYLDDDFANRMSAATGVPIAIYDGDRPIGSSFGSGIIPKILIPVKITFGEGVDSSQVPIRIALLEDPPNSGGLSPFLIFGLIAAAGISCLAISLQAVRYVSSSERRLRHEASHDALTGLANRRLFLSGLQNAFDHHRRAPERDFAVVYIDLDHFKIINDSLGHSIGDGVLVEMANRIRLCTRAGDVVARMGGDEFAILLLRVNQSRDDAMRIVRRLQHRIAAPITVEDRQIVSTASIGITFGTAGYDSAEDLMRDADAAAYRAKSLGRARHVIFDDEMLSEARDRFAIDVELRQALHRSEFALYYQPIIDLESGLRKGWEALLRWDSPRLGRVGPDTFIPIAEETGLILPIGRWVLREACMRAAAWRETYPEFRNETMSVNLSAQQLMQSDFLEELSAVLEATQLPGEALMIEITERMILDDRRLPPDVLDGCLRLGVSLCLDDFGTGYSSLTYLRRFPIQRLKIDRSFIGGNGSVLESPQIVEMLVHLGRVLNIEVVAEGIETREQLLALRSLGCKLGQGYGIAPPQTEMEAQTMMEPARVLHA